ncbi:MAG: sensor histidine kinase [Streptosporangiales bacterium]|nr:sensor histidine kinase [Streptosporangiales bacterium]
MKVTRALLNDAVAAVVLAVAGVLTTLPIDIFQEEDRLLDPLAYILVAGVGLSLVARRQWPIVALIVATLLTTTYLTIGYPYGSIMFLYAIATYSLARHRPLAHGLPYALGSLVVLLIHIFFNNTALEGFAGFGPATAWMALPFAIGVAVRLTREATERARQETLRQHINDERLRVAQEVHDIVGHGLAAIKMQADVALHVLAKKPDQAEVALETISRTSSQALDELRATLALVRRTEEESMRAPAPSLARLDDLRSRMSGAGVTVSFDTTGEARPLPAIVDLTGYRIVQESLTNVLKHSGSGNAAVTVAYEPDAVGIVVSNTVNGAPGPGGGLGIPGMRERVHTLGGVFSAGATAEGRFEVRASIPTGGHP